MSPNTIIRSISVRESRAVRLVCWLRKALCKERETNRQLWSEVRRLRAIVRELKVKPTYREDLCAE